MNMSGLNSAWDMQRKKMLMIFWGRVTIEVSLDRTWRCCHTDLLGDVLICHWVEALLEWGQGRHVFFWLPFSKLTVVAMSRGCPLVQRSGLYLIILCQSRPMVSKKSCWEQFGICLKQTYQSLHKAVSFVLICSSICWNSF
jgi:hypothetical protein